MGRLEVDEVAGESLFNALVRYMIHNQISGGFLATRFESRARLSMIADGDTLDFSSWRMLSSSDDLRFTARTELGYSDKFLSFCDVHTLMSAGDGRWVVPVSTTLRWCPICLELGFHSAIQQALAVEHCFVHHEDLMTTCDQCRSSIQVTLRDIKGDPIEPPSCDCGKYRMYVGVVPRPNAKLAKLYLDIYDYVMWGMTYFSWRSDVSNRFHFSRLAAPFRNMTKSYFSGPTDSDRSETVQIDRSGLDEENTERLLPLLKGCVDEFCKDLIRLLKDDHADCWEASQQYIWNPQVREYPPPCVFAVSQHVLSSYFGYVSGSDGDSGANRSQIKYFLDEAQKTVLENHASWVSDVLSLSTIAFLFASAAVKSLREYFLHLSKDFQGCLPIVFSAGQEVVGREHLLVDFFPDPVLIRHNPERAELTYSKHVLPPCNCEDHFCHSEHKFLVQRRSARIHLAHKSLRN